VKVGDLVKHYSRYDDGIVKNVTYGIVVELCTDSLGVRLCTVLGDSGEVKKVGFQNIELVNESW
jgi:hypothetical protein